MTLGEKIKQFRVNKGWTQPELAERSGISRVSIGYYERGERTPGKKQIEKIATALGIDPIDLIGWSYFDTKLSNLNQNIENGTHFESYLSKLGYSIETKKAGQSESGWWEDHKDKNDVIIGNSFIADEEFFEVTLLKGKIKAIFTADEFEELQSKFIELQKKVDDLLSDNQAIIEMRIQKQATRK